MTNISAKLRVISSWVVALMILTVPVVLFAATGDANDLRRYSQGGFSLVQCDGVPDLAKGEVKCDFAALINQVKFLVNWMFYIAIPFTVGLFAYAGVLFMSTDPKNVTKARGLFGNVVKGFVIMLLAWLIVRTILYWIAEPGFGTQLIQ